jgi:hypothetical protein
MIFDGRYAVCGVCCESFINNRHFFPGSMHCTLDLRGH